MILERRDKMKIAVIGSGKESVLPACPDASDSAFKPHAYILHK
jgi:hypothetical protein